MSSMRSDNQGRRRLYQLMSLSMYLACDFEACGEMGLEIQRVVVPISIREYQLAAGACSWSVFVLP
jgi:hypothetical protein